jgi:hypothetical protein
VTSSEHVVVIERRGVAHQARCGCGWTGHKWNELRPAEADAWHHTYGDERVVDGSAADAAAAAARLAQPAGASGSGSGSVEKLVDVARTLARGTSPHRRAAILDLTRAADGSTAVLSEAEHQVGELLRRHAQRNGGAADQEWLELHTARRLLDAARAQVEV